MVAACSANFIPLAFPGYINMKLNLTTSFYKSITNIAFVLCLCAMASCQPAETADSAEAGAVAETATAAADTTAKRPAPEFFVIPESMVRKRVWICEDGVADIFHVQHDCPVLVKCKGSFRNLLLPRAIEDYGRYNCQECSKDLDDIFDKDAVREMGA